MDLQQVFQDYGDFFLDVDNQIAVAICVAVVTVWIWSGCFASSVAETRMHGPLMHFIAGLAIPIVYPLVILIVLPYRTVKREAESGVLSVIRLVPQLTRPVGIIHTRRNGNAQRFSRAVQEFIDFLLEHAGPSVDVEQFATSRHQLVSEPA